MLHKSVYQRLRSGDKVPEGTPKRYRDGYGYIRLRWKTGPRTYAEVSEHRLLMGMPPDTMEVHHINGNRADNRPENLEVLPIVTHRQLGVTFDVEAARTAYLAGASYPELGTRFNVHHVNVMRALKNRGMQSRPAPKDQTHCIRGHAFTEANTHRDPRGRRCCRACIANRYKMSKKEAAAC